MRRFEIFTDSSCDLTQEIIEQFDLHVMQLEVVIDDNPPVLNNQLDFRQIVGECNSATEVIVKVSEELIGYIREFSEDAIKEKIIV